MLILFFLEVRWSNFPKIGNSCRTNLSTWAWSEIGMGRWDLVFFFFCGDSSDSSFSWDVVFRPKDRFRPRASRSSISLHKVSKFRRFLVCVAVVALVRGWGDWDECRFVVALDPGGRPRRSPVVEWEELFRLSLEMLRVRSPPVAFPSAELEEESRTRSWALILSSLRRNWNWEGS